MLENLSFDLKNQTWNLQCRSSGSSRHFECDFHNVFFIFFPIFRINFWEKAEKNAIVPIGKKFPTDVFPLKKIKKALRLFFKNSAILKKTGPSLGFTHNLRISKVFLFQVSANKKQKIFNFIYFFSFPSQCFPYMHTLT